MSEWSKEHAWKVCMGQKLIVGSNPTPSTSFLSSSPGPLYGRGFLLPSRIKKAFYAALGRLGFWLPARLPRYFGGYTPQKRVTLAKNISMFDPRLANYHSILGLHEPLDVYPFHLS